jgi:hypothetical protein
LTLGSILNFLKASGNIHQSQINRIIEDLHESVPEIKGDVKNEKIFKLTHIKKRTSTITVTGLEDVLEENARDREMVI